MKTLNETAITAVSPRIFYPILALLCVAAYLPTLNNGFIADDYVLLDYSDRLASDFFFLFNFPPLNFRLTSIALYHGLKTLFGYHAEFFYTFTIVLHFTNAVLLSKLIQLLTGNRAISRLASVLFIVFQGPQEAIMWITAMGETFQGFFILCSLIMWVKERYGISALFYFFALFSKESAVILLALVPFVQLHQRQSLVPAAYSVLLVPTSVFAAAFFFTWSTNHLIQYSMYTVSFGAAVVLVKSLLRLLWPWLVIAVAAFRFDLRKWPDVRVIGAFVACIVTTLLPYIFLTYSSYVPSRQVYLGSMVLCWCIAVLWNQLKTRKVQAVFLVAFLTVNLAYLWIQKDTQFENRAAPTTELLRLLRTHQPTQVMLYDFPYPLPEIPKAVTLLVPGWTRDLVHMNGPGETCVNCVKLRWDPKSKTYSGNWPQL